jgi:hypothetical protein
MEPEKIVEQLSMFPHRAVASGNETKTLDFLSGLFENQQVVRERFRTPKNYIVIVLWLISGLVAGLLLLHAVPVAGLFLVIIFATMALLYFNWYASPVTNFPPLKDSYNLVVKKESRPGKKKLLLMAHWDTAPISILYTPKMVGNFRSSLKITLILMVMAEFTAVFHYFMPNKITMFGLVALALYFGIQAVVATVDFFRFGYSNGASDNATGVAAAIQTARNLWDKPLKNLDVELVLTGAEEVGMIGSKAYLKKHYKEFNKNTFLINFDTLGGGNLKIINKTGSWGDIVYTNKLVEIAEGITAAKTGLDHVKTGAWHTADFDSVWFHRAGIPSVTLAALDTNGRMPNIHRPTDILDNVDFRPMNDAILLATLMGEKLNKNE